MCDRTTTWRWLMCEDEQPRQMEWTTAAQITAVHNAKHFAVKYYINVGGICVCTMLWNVSV